MFGQIILDALRVSPKHIKYFFAFVPVVYDSQAASLASTPSAPANLSQSTATLDQNTLLRSQHQRALQGTVLSIRQQVLYRLREYWCFSKVHFHLYAIGASESRYIAMNRDCKRSPVNLPF